MSGCLACLCGVCGVHCVVCALCVPCIMLPIRVRIRTTPPLLYHTTHTHTHIQNVVDDVLLHASEWRAMNPHAEVACASLWFVAQVLGAEGGWWETTALGLHFVARPTQMANPCRDRERSSRAESLGWSNVFETPKVLAFRLCVELTLHICLIQTRHSVNN